MRMSNKNKQKMHYSLKQKREPIYALDDNGNKIIEYIDENGNIYYKETGEYTSEWSKPVMFKGNIAMSGGESEAVEYGLNLSDYEAVLIMPKGKLPITETSRLWYQNEPKFKGDGEVDIDSADYSVKKISPSLNFVKYILQKEVT